MSNAADPLSSADTIAQFDRYVIPNYRRFPVCLVRGEGSWVWDAEGNRYLDFFPGWGCNLLGHCPPRVVEAVREQVGQLIHVPNTWYMEAQGRVRPGPLGAVVRRPVLLLQQRGRGQRGGHQAGARRHGTRRADSRSSRWRAASTAGPTPP